MNFMYPSVLALILVPVLLFAYLFLSKKERLSRIFAGPVLKRLSAANEGMPLWFRHILMFLSLLLMLFALARPVMEKGDKTVEVQGLTLLAALDISGSMRSKDVYPNRLEFAKKKMTAFFDAMPSDEVGVVAFAYSSFMLAPFSSDKDTLKMMIEGVDDSYINMGSTDFSVLAELVASTLEEKKPKILVLFTDGGDEEAIAGFADILEANEIDLYVVLVGTDKGAPVLDEEGKPLSLKDGSIAISQRNDALGEVAIENDGAFVIAANGKEDIEELVAVIRGKYKNQEQGAVKVTERIEYFYYPLGFALFFLLLALASLPRRKI